MSDEKQLSLRETFQRWLNRDRKEDCGNDRGNLFSPRMDLYHLNTRRDFKDFKGTANQGTDVEGFTLLKRCTNEVDSSTAWVKTTDGRTYHVSAHKAHGDKVIIGPTADNPHPMPGSLWKNNNGSEIETVAILNNPELAAKLLSAGHQAVQHGIFRSGNAIDDIQTAATQAMCQAKLKPVTGCPAK
jgi:hypothetical protein